MYCNKISVQFVKDSGNKEYYKCLSSLLTGCKKKRYGEKIMEKGPKMYQNEQQLCISLRKDSTRSLPVFYRYY